MYIVKLAIADLAEYLADGKRSPDVWLAPTLTDPPDDRLKVRDVVSIGDDLYQVLVERPNGRSFAMTLAGSEWFETTDKAVSELA